MRIDWDPQKADISYKKHGISFNDASKIFGDALSLTIADPIHSYDEDRFLTIGVTPQLRILVVSHTNRADHIRIISAREATDSERRKYEEGYRG